MITETLVALAEIYLAMAIIGGLLSLALCIAAVLILWRREKEGRRF
jgi:hypothetical protein